MSLKAGVINVELRLEKDQYDVSITQAGQQLKNYQGYLSTTSQRVKDVERSHSTATQMLRQFVLTVASVKFAMRDLNETIFALPSAALKASGEIEKMTQLMKGLSKETTEVKKAAEAASNVDFIFNLAKNAPFEVGALTDSFIKLKSGGLDPTKGGMEALVDSVAKFGGNSESLKRASVAIQQMMGKGVVSMEELRQQLGEAIPDAMAMMAEGSGQSMAEFTKNVATGTVESSSAIDRMLTIMAMRNEGKAEEMMQTWVGMLEQLKTQWTLTLNDLGTAGLSDSAKDAIKEITQMLASPEFKVFASEMGAAFSDMIRFLTDAMKLAIEFREELGMVGHVMLTYFAASKIAPMLEGMGQSFKKMYAGMMMQVDLYKVAKANEHKTLIALAQKEQLEKYNLANLEYQSNLKNKVSKLEAIAEVAVATKAATIAEKLQIKELELAETLRNEKVISQMTILDAKQAGMRGRELTALGQQEAKRVALIEASHAKILAASQRGHNMQMAMLKKEHAARIALAEQEVINAGLVVASSQKSLDAINKNVDGINRYDRMAGTLGFTLAGLGNAFKSLLGPMGLLFIAIESGIYLWDKYAESANRAADRARIAKNAEKGVTSEEEFKKTASDLVAQQKRRKEVNALIDMSEKDENAFLQRIALQSGNSATIILSNESKKLLVEKERKKLIDERNKINKEAGELYQTYSRQSKIMREQDSNSIVSADMGVVDSDIKRLNLTNQSRINEFDAQIAQIKNGNENEKVKSQKIEDLRKEQRAIWTSGLQNEISEYDKYIAKVTSDAQKLQAKKDKLTQDEQYALDLLIAKQTAATEKRNNAVNKLGDGTYGVSALGTVKTMISGGEDKPSATAKRATASDWMNDIRNDIQILQAKYQELTLTAEQLEPFREEAAARVRDALDGGKFDKITGSGKKKRNVKANEAPAGAEELEMMKLALTKLGPEYANAQKSAADEIARIRERFADQLIKSSSKADTRAEGDEYMPQSVISYRQSISVAIEDIRKKYDTLLAGKSDMERKLAADSEISGLMKVAKSHEENLYSAETDKYLVELEKRNRGLQTFYKTEEQLKTDAHQRNIADVTARANIDKLAGEERIEAERKLLAQIALMNAAHAYEMRTPLQKLTDSWKDATGQMKQASADWGRDFIDRMVEGTKKGEFEFGDMVDAILTDILRIQYQKTMGGAVQSVFDGIATGIGGVIDNSGKDKNGVQTPGFFESITKGVEDFARSLGFGSDTTGEFTEEITESVAQSAIETSASGASTNAIQFLATTANAAAQALNQLAASAGGASISSGGGGDGFLGGLMGGLGGLFSSGSDMSPSASYGGVVGMGDGGGSWFDNLWPFADGGIMSGFGSVPLNYYSKGGVADSPQLAVFGEGRMNEAFVPLPDGRSIPVTMTGGMGGGANVTVNVIGAPEGTTTQQKRDSNGDMSIDVIIGQIEGKISQNVAKGRGSLTAVLENTYKLNRAAGAR